MDDTLTTTTTKPTPTPPFGDTIAALVLDYYHHRLPFPKKGKPQLNEWTCLASIILEDTSIPSTVEGTHTNNSRNANEPTDGDRGKEEKKGKHSKENNKNKNNDKKAMRYRVASLATGNKCMGFVEKTKDGNLLHDSHAEIIARR